jgi:hypothetical protein
MSSRGAGTARPPSERTCRACPGRPIRIGGGHRDGGSDAGLHVWESAGPAILAYGHAQSDRSRANAVAPGARSEPASSSYIDAIEGCPGERSTLRWNRVVHPQPGIDLHPSLCAKLMQSSCHRRASASLRSTSDASVASLRGCDWTRTPSGPLVNFQTLCKATTGIEPV